MSSGLSGAFQSANMLAKEYDGVVHVVDNHRISVTQRHSVLDALALCRQGCTAKEIKGKLEQSAYDSIIFIGVEDGISEKWRPSSSTAKAVGEILNIKPLLT